MYSANFTPLWENAINETYHFYDFDEALKFCIKRLDRFKDVKILNFVGKVVVAFRTVK